MNLLIRYGFAEADLEKLPLEEGDIIEIGGQQPYPTMKGQRYTANVIVHRGEQVVARGFASFLGHPHPFVEIARDGMENLQIYCGREYSFRNGRINDGTLPQEFLWRFERHFRKAVAEINRARQQIGLPAIEIQDVDPVGSVSLAMFCTSTGDSRLCELAALREMHRRESRLMSALHGANAILGRSGQRKLVWVGFFQKTYPEIWHSIDDEPEILVRREDSSVRRWMTVGQLLAVE